MKVLFWTDRLKLTDNDLDVITEALLEDKGLQETSDRLNNKITSTQVYAVASAIAIEEFEESTETMAPYMTEERIKLSELMSDTWAETSARKRDNKCFESIIEDFVFFRDEQNRKFG